MSVPFSYRAGASRCTNVHDGGSAMGAALPPAAVGKALSGLFAALCWRPRY
jgi:hypothetical protein